VKVELRGDELVLVGGDRTRRLRLASELRSRLGNVVRVRPGGYGIPVAAAGVLASLSGEDLEWADEASTIGREQIDRRERHLAAWSEVAEAIADPDAAMAEIALGLELDRHQKEAAAAIATPSSQGLALFDEQGTGKTISCLAGFALLRARGLVERALVVAPKSVLGSWEVDGRRVLGSDAQIVTLKGGAAQRRAAARGRHDLLLANYEAVVSDLTTLEMVFRAKPERYLLIVDESYFAKNPDARRSEALATLRRHCRRAVVLCGTPAPNAPWDLVNQVNLADGGLTFGPLRVPRDQDEARARVVEGLGSALYLRRLKSQVLDLPAQDFYRVSVPMQPRQRALYERAARELALEVRSVTDEVFRRGLAHYLARRQVLLRLCSQPASVEPLYAETPAKLLALDAILGDVVESKGEKAVVWCWFRSAIDAVAGRYERYGVARIDGSVADAGVRTAAIERFQFDPATRLFVGNAAAAGAGITLTAARTAVYESFSNQAAHYMQSLDRIHRRGQSRGVSYFVLVCEDTIEEGEYERLIDKQRDARQLLGDPDVEAPSRTVFLADIERGVHLGSAD
jgi:SNF2 family DNA or RNA helicase